MKNQILYKGVEKINEIEGIECQVLAEEIRIANTIEHAKIQLEIGQKRIEYYVEAKTQVVPANVVFLMKQLEESKPYMIIAEYITTNAMSLLKKMNIPYADTKGNMFIRNDLFYLHVQTTNRTRAKATNRAFSKTGLKVVYQLLLHPTYLNEPYRFIGEKANVTIDTVGKVISGLLKDRHVYRVDNKKYQYTDRKKLFQTWATEFNKNLRPKLNKRRFAWLDEKCNWKELELPQGSYWGGAAAAEKLSNYLIADKFIIYSDMLFQQMLKALRIVPDNNGRIEVIEKFWTNNSANDVVHPILIYTDLVNEVDPRNIETANKIFDEYIENQL